MLPRTSSLRLTKGFFLMGPTSILHRANKAGHVAVPVILKVLSLEYGTKEGCHCIDATVAVSFEVIFWQLQPTIVY
jgi:hypothetical protein